MSALAPRVGVMVEAQRVLAICNACRYCEGYWPCSPRSSGPSRSRGGRALPRTSATTAVRLYAAVRAAPRIPAEFPADPRRCAPAATKVRCPGAGRAFEATAGGELAAASGGAVVRLHRLYGTRAVFSAWSDVRDRLRGAPHEVMVAVFGWSPRSCWAFVMCFSRSGATPANHWASRESVPLPAPRGMRGLRFLDGGCEGCNYTDESVRSRGATSHSVLRVPAVLRGDQRGDDYHFVSAGRRRIRSRCR